MDWQDVGSRFGRDRTAGVRFQGPGARGGGYGERTINTTERVRAWREVVVKRQPEFVDPSNKPTDLTERLNTTNQRFGPQFRIVPFRWLAGGEA